MLGLSQRKLEELQMIAEDFGVELDTLLRTVVIVAMIEWEHSNAFREFTIDAIHAEKRRMRAMRKVAMASVPPPVVCRRCGLPLMRTGPTTAECELKHPWRLRQTSKEPEASPK